MSQAHPGEVGLKLVSLAARLRTDEPSVAAFCRDLFARFVTDSGVASFGLDIHRETSDGKPGWRVRDGMLDVLVHREAWLAGIVAARFLETAGNRVDEFDLFHAATVSRDGRGLLVTGESGFGKSVLSLGLLSRGFGFLSDEVAVLDRERPVLSPFPKAIEVRPEAARLVGLTPHGRPRRAGKLLEDAEAWFPGCLSEPCPLSAVVFLAGHEEEAAAPAAGRLELAVHRRDPELAAALSRLDGIHAVSWRGERDGCALLRIDHEPERFEAWRLDEVLGQRGVLIVSSSADEKPPVSFDHEPRLVPIAAHAGVAGLLKAFRGKRALARRIEMHDGDFGRLFLALLERLRGVRFFRLQVGQLEPSLSLLEEIVTGQR